MKCSHTPTKMPSHHYYPHILYMANLDGNFQGDPSGSSTKNNITVINSYVFETNV